MFEIIALLFLNWFMVSIGFRNKDFAILSISGFFMMALGVFIVLNGNGLLIYSMSLVHFALGFYLIIRSNIEISLKPPEDSFNLIKAIKNKLGGKDGRKKGK